MQNSLQSLYSGPFLTLPSILMAAFLVVLGIVLGKIARSIVMRVFKKGRVDDVLVATGAHTMVEKTGYPLNTGALVGSLLKWFIILFFIDVALDVLHLQAATAFLGGIVLAYVPRIFVAVVLMFAAFVLAHMAEKSIVGGAHGEHAHRARALGKLVRTLILVCAALAVLAQLHIATEMAIILFGGIVFASALALGIAFGYAGREMAGQYLESVAGKKE